MKNENLHITLFALAVVVVIAVFTLAFMSVVAPQTLSTGGF